MSFVEHRSWATYFIHISFKEHKTGYNRILDNNIKPFNSGQELQGFHNIHLLLS